MASAEKAGSDDALTRRSSRLGTRTLTPSSAALRTTKTTSRTGGWASGANAPSQTSTPSVIAPAAVTASAKRSTGSRSQRSRDQGRLTTFWSSAYESGLMTSRYDNRPASDGVREHVGQLT